MKKNFIQNAITGMGFGFPVTVLCMTMFGGFNSATRELLTWMIASALYGLLSGGIFHTKNNLPLPAAVGLHGVGCVVITMAAAGLCGYIRSAADVLPVLIPAVVIYAVIYIICFLLMKQNEKQVNEALQKKAE